MISSRTALNYAALIWVLVALACARPPAIYLHDGSQLSQTDLAEILGKSPLGPDDNIRVTTLGGSGSASHHIVQIRHRETPHIHKDHDLTVVLLKGEGYLMLDDRRIDLDVSDIVFIPRAVPHYFVNTFREPSVGLAVFSPAFDGKDTLPVAGR